VAVNTTLTPTLTQVLRDAAAARSLAVCKVSSGSSTISGKFMVGKKVVRRKAQRALCFSLTTPS
jgi:hypothetical protein